MGCRRSTSLNAVILREEPKRANRQSVGFGNFQNINEKRHILNPGRHFYPE